MKPLVCGECGLTLEIVGVLIRCRLCRNVLMCEAHIGGHATLADAPDLLQPICAACLIDIVAHPARPM